MNGVGEWSIYERKARRRAGKALGKGEGPSGGKAPRRLQAEVVAKFNAQDWPEAPWRAAAAARKGAIKGGSKGKGESKEGKGKGKASGDREHPNKMAWPFGPTPGSPGAVPQPARRKLHCQNPNCPGFAGKFSFKYHDRIGE